MLLILTNSLDATADYLVSVLNRHGIPFLRFDTNNDVPKITIHYSGDRPILQIDGRSYRPDDFSNVWYRRPERLQCHPFDSSPEGTYIVAEWAEALEGFFAQIPMKRWINHPSSNFSASHKIEQLSRAKSLGLLIPDTLVTQDAEQLRTFFAQHPVGIITKPMASGYVERPASEPDSLIYTNVVSAEHLSNLDDLANCPTLFQQLIAKRSDVRITILDDAIHAVMLIAREADGSQRCDVRRNNMDDVTYEAVTLPPDIQAKLKTLMAQYNLRFAAIDMAVGVDDRWYFFEINPNGQWAWLDLVAGMNIAGAFVEALRA
jgi:hypothetical protein